MLGFKAPRLEFPCKSFLFTAVCAAIWTGSWYVPRKCANYHSAMRRLFCFLLFIAIVPSGHCSDTLPEGDAVETSPCSVPKSDNIRPSLGLSFQQRPLLATQSTASNTTKYAVQEPPLTTDWTYKVGTNPWSEYPRPQLQRSEWQNLNGIWTYQNASSLNSSQTPPFGQTLLNEVLVPSCLESGLSGAPTIRISDCGKIPLMS